jgi:hypothetical protein
MSNYLLALLAGNLAGVLIGWFICRAVTASKTQRTTRLEQTLRALVRPYSEGPNVNPPPTFPKPPHGSGVEPDSPWLRRGAMPPGLERICADLPPPAAMALRRAWREWHCGC